MPLYVPEEDEPAGLRVPTYTPPAAPTPPDPDPVAASFRQNNIVVNLMMNLAQDTFPAVAGYRASDDIRGTRYEEMYGDRFIDSRSPDETRAIMSRIEGEEQDRRTSEANGLPGMFLDAFTGMLDPTILLPAGQVVRAGRGGYSAARSAASIGAAAAIQTAGQEAVLQATQELRTAGESATAIASASLLGGVLGAGAARLLSGAERRAIERGLDEVRPMFGPNGASAPSRVPDELAAGMPEAEVGRKFGGDSMEPPASGTIDLGVQGEEARGPGVSPDAGGDLPQPVVIADSIPAAGQVEAMPAPPRLSEDVERVNPPDAAPTRSVQEPAVPEPPPFSPPPPAPPTLTAPDQAAGATPAWAVRHESDVGGRIVFSDERTALLEGFSMLNGRPVYVGVHANGQRTRGDIESYTGSLFSPEQKARLIERKRSLVAEDARLHAERPDGPFTGGVRFAASANVPPGVAETARGWLDMLGIKSRVYLTTVQDARAAAEVERSGLYGPFSAVRSAGVDRGEMGSTRRMANGDHYISIVPQGRRSLTLETLAHEIGHILEREEWSSASTATKDAVLGAYKSWLNEVGNMSAEEWVKSLRPHVVGKTTTVKSDLAAKDMPPYWRSFSEWFADQVARWAVSEQKPQSLIERFFSRVGRALKRLYSSAAGAKSLPSEQMRAYLNERALTFSPEPDVTPPRPTGQLDGGMTGSRVPAASVGAAAVDARSLELSRSGLTDIPVLGRLIEKTSPTMRVFTLPFTSARRLMADLAETSLEFVDNAAGVPTTRGAALDRLVRTQVAQARVAVADEMDRLFSEMRFNGPVALPAARAWGERLFGRDAEVTGIPRTMEEFRREVGRAMRRGDQSEIPQVAAAAQMMRAKVFEPWKQRAIEAKLLPEDVDVKTAESYFQRVYDKGKINAQRPDFEERITGWLRGEQEANAAVQSEIADLDATRRRLNAQIGKLEARVQRAQKRIADLTSRLDEAAGTVARGERRADTLAQREALLAGEVADIEEFIRDMREVVTDPTAREMIDRMERELADLRRQDKPPTLAQVERAEREELAGILTGENRMAAEILVGRRKPFKPRSFLSMIQRAGGIQDQSGEVLAALGGDARARPGLINGDARDADDWGEKLMEMSEGRLTERPTPTDVLNWIHEAARGNEPSWWQDVTMTPAQQQAARASDLAAVWDEMFSRAGIRVQKVADVAAVLREQERASGAGLVTLEDLDKIAAELEAVGEAVPVAARRGAVEEELFLKQSAIRDARAQIAEARKARGRKRARLRDTAIRAGEAGVADTANRGRLRILEDRMAREEERGVLVDSVLETMESLRAHNRRQIEQAIGKWRGQSTAEAMAALKRVADLTAERAPGAPRLSSADRAVDRAVKRIMRSQKDLSDEELRNVASEIVDRIVGSPDGRLPYDMDTAKAARGSGDAPRGPLAARRFNIPDEMIEDWLIDDAEEIAGIHLRTIVPDVLLAERYGDADMTVAFRGLADEHAALAREAGSEAERVKLRKEYDGAVRDLAAVRDRIRGTFGFSSDSRLRNLGRVSQAVRAFNTITMMGGAAVSSLSDAAGAVFRHGFGTVLRDVWAPLAAHLAQGLPKDGAMAQARQQYRAMGIAAEMALGQRHQSFDEIGNVYRPGSRLERALSWGADRFQMLNLLAPWTDMQKTMAAVVSGNEVLRAAKAAAEGKATARQVKNLAAAGIDQQMAGTIWREFAASGEIVDGVHLPNTGDWASREARDAFEGAVAREVDIAVITPGQEKPLWMSDPILATFGQFKAFTAAATERLLIANLQRHDLQSLQGVVLSVALGVLSYRAYTLATGQKTSDRPQDWIKEGVSRAGLLGWLEEGNALAAKATRGSVDIYRVIGADKPLSKFASRSVLGQLLGPTAGRIEALTQVTGAAASGEWSAADSRRLRSFIALQNLFYLRRGLDAVEAGVNERLGIPALPQ